MPRKKKASSIEEAERPAILPLGGPDTSIRISPGSVQLIEEITLWYAVELAKKGDRQSVKEVLHLSKDRVLQHVLLSFCRDYGVPTGIATNGES